MEITEVRIKLMEGAEDRLRGFCSITFDHCFVVRDLKIIQGNNGPFVAMPSRKLTSNCPKCRSKNHLRSNFCNQCGSELKNVQLNYDPSGRAKLYADIAHPVNPRCREMIQKRIVEELNREVELAGQPGYRSRYDDEYDDDFDLVDLTETSKARNSSKPSSSLSRETDAGEVGAEETDAEETDAEEVGAEEVGAEEVGAEGTEGQTKQRSDLPDSSLPAPHETPRDLPNPSSQSSSDEDFGKGVF